MLYFPVETFRTCTQPGFGLDNNKTDRVCMQILDGRTVGTEFHGASKHYIMLSILKFYGKHFRFPCAGYKIAWSGSCPKNIRTSTFCTAPKAGENVSHYHFVDILFGFLFIDGCPGATDQSARAKN